MSNELNEKPIDLGNNNIINENPPIQESFSEKPKMDLVGGTSNQISNQDPRIIIPNRPIDTKQQEEKHKEGDEKESNYSTLDETVLETLGRDLKRICHKLEYVLLPRFSANKSTELQNWDLWGPLAICILLCVTISVGRDGTSTDTSFISVFAIVWFGGIIITFNAQFLGAKIGICQSICLLGYCVFPILIGAIINRIIDSYSAWAKVICIVLAVVWSCFSSVGFISTLTVPEKKFIISFPVFLFFTSLAMFVLNC